MSKITNTELDLLRTQPHSTKLWLSVYQPTTVLACRLNNASISKGARTIAYDSVSEGTHVLVQADMSMWVGTLPGKADKGIIRVRSADANEIEVAENDHINWSDNDHLTIVSYYEINAVYPRIVQPDPDELEVIFYKDFDIEYTNQNSILGSFVCMGGHYAGWKNDPVYYSASGTTNLRGSGLSYEWFFEGADTTGSSVQNPGYINYSTPGHYTTRLTVTAGNGAVDVAQRHVSIYDKPDEGTNTPLLLWSLQDLSGNRDAGGYTGRITIHQEVDDEFVKDGSLIVIFSDDRYGETEQSIGGNAENRSSVFFSGYVLDGSIEFDYRNSMVEFEFGSPTELMKMAEGFSATLEADKNPSFWYQMLDMDCRRAIYHYLRWQSTVSKTCDIKFLGTDYKIQYFDADRETLFDGVNSLMETTLKGKLVSDRQGRLYFEVDGYTDGITLENTFTLKKQDWIGEPEISQAQLDTRSFIEAGGIAYSGVITGTFSAHLAQAPGDAPGYRGGLDRFQGLALEGQKQLNKLVGDIYAWENNEFPNNVFGLAGDFRNFDIAPQELTSINIFETDTIRNVNFIGETFLVESINWTYDSRLEILTPRIVFAMKTEGFAGDTIPIPDVPDVGGFGNTPPFDIPPFEIPPFDGGICFDLYDEGILLGCIDEIDFQGSPVQAVLDGTRGDVTFVCDNTLTGNDSIAQSGRRSGFAVSCGSEADIGGMTTVFYSSGITQSGNKYTVNVNGVYNASVLGQVLIPSLNLCANKGSQYEATITIKLYDVSDTLKDSVSTITSKMYCFEDGSANDVVIDKGSYSAFGIFSAVATDYFKFTVNATCPSTATVDFGANIYRIT